MSPSQAQRAAIGATRATRTAIAALTLAAVGCGVPAPMDEEIDEIELLSTAQEWEDVPLGVFSVSVPGVQPHPMGGPEARNLVQMDFRLSMQTEIAAAAAARAEAERRHGEVCNRVIGVCRSTDLHDLGEQDLVTFKSHLLDALEPLFGRNVIARLIVNDLMTNPL